MKKDHYKILFWYGVVIFILLFIMTTLTILVNHGKIVGNETVPVDIDNEELPQHKLN